MGRMVKTDPGFTPGTQQYASKLARMEDCVRALLIGIGEDTAREGLLDTPKRVAKAFMDITEGYRQCASGVLGTALFHEALLDHGQDSASGGLVLVRDIDFASTSEDTLLPFHGRCHIAYLPCGGVVLGLSKLARLTRLCVKRLQTQQRLTRELCSLLLERLHPAGVAVVVEARHLSFSAQPPPVCVSAAVAGAFAAPESALVEELFAMLQLSAPLDSVAMQVVQPAPSTAAPDTADPAAFAALSPSAPALYLGTTATNNSMASLHSEGRDGGIRGSWLGPITPDASDGDSDAPSEPASCRSGGDSDADLQTTTSMESAMAALLAEAGVDTAAPSIRAGIRRYVLSLLAATRGYYQDLPPSLCDRERARVVHPLCSALSLQRQQQGQLLHPLQQPQAHMVQQSWHSQWEVQSRWVHHSSRQRQRQQQGQDGKARLQSSPSCLHSSGSGVVFGQTRNLALCSMVLPEADGWHAWHLPFASQCEHHMLPFYGTVHIAVLPMDHDASHCTGACGLPLPTETVEAVVATISMRLQIQERITQQVAEAVARLSGCQSVMVVCRAAHMCMVARGVENHAGTTLTRTALGAFQEDGALRARFIQSIGAQAALRRTTCT